MRRRLIAPLSPSVHSSKPVRMAIYARVSSATQRERETIQSQLAVLPGFVSRLGGELVDTFVDDGISGAAAVAKRPETRRMLEAAEAGRFDSIAIIALDRLTRADDWIDRAEILGRLQRAGITIAEYETGGTLDLRDPAGDLMVSLKTSWGAQERAKIAERSRLGRDRAITIGALPAGVAPYGYRYDKRTRTWSIDPDESSVVTEVFQRLVQGETCGQIARDLTRRRIPTGRPRRNAATSWTTDRVYDIGRSSTYRGEYVARRATGESFAVPAIVETPLWQAAQIAVTARRTFPGPRRKQSNSSHVYLLQGLAVCEWCRAPIRIVSPAPKASRPGRDVAYYVCRARLRHQRGHTDRCELPYLRVSDVDQLTWTTIAQNLAEHSSDIAKTLTKRPSEPEPDRDAIIAQIAQLERVERTLLTRFRRGLITERILDTELRTIVTERESLKSEIDRQVVRTEPTETEIAAVLARLSELSTTDVPTERRALITVLIQPGGAVLGPDTLQIEALVGPWTDCMCQAPGSRTRKQYITYSAEVDTITVHWTW